MNLLNTPKYVSLNNSTRKTEISLKGLSYTYRLTYTDPNTGQVLYYMGWKTGSKKDPLKDNYFSSSQTVKKLIKEKGIENFKKKILGVFATREEAIAHEIKFHSRLQVDDNPPFLNILRQTSVRFRYGNKGSEHIAKANAMRSAKLRGVQKMTPEGRKAVAEYQRNVRVRTEQERQELRERAIERSKQETTCPHCGKIGKSIVSMHRWHFDNCPQAPNVSKKALEEREALRSRFCSLNQKHPKHQKNEDSDPDT
jgi:hypothetical protein